MGDSTQFVRLSSWLNQEILPIFPESVCLYPKLTGIFACIDHWGFDFLVAFRKVNLSSQRWLSLRNRGRQQSRPHSEILSAAMCLCLPRLPVGPFVLHEKGRIPSIPPRHSHRVVVANLLVTIGWHLNAYLSLTEVLSVDLGSNMPT